MPRMIQLSKPILWKLDKTEQAKGKAEEDNRLDGVQAPATV
jgi:hypothetical protein